MQIGHFSFDNPVILAPMAGVTDQPFRDICLRYGASLAFSEMMLANAMVWDSQTAQLRLRQNRNGINAVQIVGSDPQAMADLAQKCEMAGAEIIDINMGCPAKKVNRNAAGSALLRDPQLVQAILAKVVSAVSVPVTLKIRTGWDRHSINCTSIAKLAEDEGIAALTVHGRTRADLFNGEAEYDSIRAVKRSVSIPVIANGDITDAPKAKFVLDYTGADAVMIGRGALGKPWLFREISHYLTQKPYTPPEIDEIRSVILSHIQQLHQFYGAEKGYRIARKHVLWYCEKLQLADVTFRRDFNQITDPNAQIDALTLFLNQIQ